MELKDFIVCPILLFLIYLGAYLLRPHVTDTNTRKYFIPALGIKILGAICLGLIYQFYYGSGDTFMYHTYGSRLVWKAIFDSPFEGFSLIFKRAGDYTDVYKYASQIYFFKDPPSYFVIRIASVFDLFTFSTYSGTAMLFAVFGFCGTWALYITFYKQYPSCHRILAFAICFIPSVFFWGSGILKETIVMAALGISTYCFYVLFIEKKISWTKVLFLGVSLYLIFSVKKFVLQAYLPAVLIWILASNFKNIRSLALRVLLVPMGVVMAIASSYFAIVKVGEGDEKYDVTKIAQTAKVTAYDIRYWSGRDAGSGYELGELDGTLSSMLRLAPQAINVALFRPYLWEVRNPLMLISSLEGACFLLAFGIILWNRKRHFINSLSDPNIIFCFVFSISFAFAVGVSTFNFGTLARYKIPMMQFFATGLAIVLTHEKSRRKLDVLESVE
jgi:hypothetical protein